MAYSGASIDSLAINSLGSEYAIAKTDVGLLSAQMESGEDVRLAFNSGQVAIAAGAFFWLFQNGVWIAENIENAETINLYAAKLAGGVPDYLKLESWGGGIELGEEPPDLIDPDVSVLNITALNDEQSFSLTGYGRVAISTDSGEGFAFGFVSGEVDGASGDDFGVVRQNGVWEIDNLDPLNTDTIYLAKRVGGAIDKYKIEHWDVA